VARKRRAELFEMQVQGMTVRVTAPPEDCEEARASAMHFWDQVSSYAARNHEFRGSNRPVALPDDAPAAMRAIAETASAAGVGPKFVLNGALVDHLGAFLAARSTDVVVAVGGGYFAAPERRLRLTAFRGEERGEGFAVMVDPAAGPTGIYTTMGRTELPTHNVDGLVVLAESCALADGAAMYALGLLDKPDHLESALAYLQQVAGVRGAIAIQRGRIGMAGAVEIAA
jgi:hypothetical protein